MQRVGFDDRIGRKRIFDLIDRCYEIDLMVVVQLVRWYEIGLVKPGEIDVPHPAMLMIDLGRRRARRCPVRRIGGLPVGDSRRGAHEGKQSHAEEGGEGMKSRQKNRGLSYYRRSDDKQEASLGQQHGGARETADKIGVTFRGTT